MTARPLKTARRIVAHDDARFIRQAVSLVEPYRPGMSLREAQQRFGRSDFSKLASNENLFGPSPKTLEAITGHLGEINLYPDPQCSILRERLASDLDVSPDRLLFGNGSEQILEVLMQATLGPGDRILLSSPTFPLYALFATAIGATIEDVPRRADMSIDIPATVDALSWTPKLFFLCNPNNPTGTGVSAEEFERIATATTPDTLIVVDEAYREYADPKNYPDSVATLSRLARPYIILRTFSKAYGLAGLRIGYGIASSSILAELIIRIRTQFAVSNLAQASALAAWLDRPHLETIVSVTVEGRRKMSKALAEIGLSPVVSQTNFLFYDATPLGLDATDRLMKEGVIVRPIAFDGRLWHRLTIGKATDNDRSLSALRGLCASRR